MKIFKINKDIEIVCKSENTRYGFRHLATLFKNGIEETKGKCCYYNRTWESYEFQSVLMNVINKSIALTDKEKKICIDFAHNKKEDLSEFKTVGMVALLGDVFCDNIKDKNDWKTRMLKAGLESKGLVMPNDWNELDENTKEVRLNKVIEQMRKVN